MVTETCLLVHPAEYQLVLVVALRLVKARTPVLPQVFVRLRRSPCRDLRSIAILVAFTEASFQKMNPLWTPPIPLFLPPHPQPLTFRPHQQESFGHRTALVEAPRSQTYAPVLLVNLSSMNPGSCQPAILLVSKARHHDPYELLHRL